MSHSLAVLPAPELVEGPGGPRWRQFPQRPPHQECAHWGRAGGTLGAAGPDSTL